MQQGEEHTAEEGEQHRQIEGNWRVACKILCDTDCKECAAECAEALQSFDGKVSDAAALIVDATDCHNK